MTNHRKEVVFYKLGGAWATTPKNGEYLDEGILDTQEVYEIEKQIGFFSENANYPKLEWSLAQHIYKVIKDAAKKSDDLYKKLSFVPDFSHLVKGKYIEIYSGSSALMRASYIASFLTFFLEQAKEYPTLPMLGSIGRDTIDIHFLLFWDIYTFDTSLPPLILTGANRGLKEHSSDAPQNLYDLMYVSTANLPPGGYWVFASQVFRASDFVKVTPFELTAVDALSNFYSPHLKSEPVDEIQRKYKNIRPNAPINTSSYHVSKTNTLEKLFSAIQQIAIVDLGDQNELIYEKQKILDKNVKAVIIVGHSYGNVDNPTKYFCMQAALQNKLVILVSRCLIGEVKEKWPSSLLKLNHQLGSQGKRIISGYKLNKNVAKALAARAIQENLNQNQTQELFNKYASARGLSEHDKVVI